MCQVVVVVVKLYTEAAVHCNIAFLLRKCLSFVGIPERYKSVMNRLPSLVI